MIKDEGDARRFVADRCDEAAFERLEQLVGALRVENDRQNLVSRGTLDSVWQRHIADSAQLLDHVPRETTGSWLDLGTGAGFPGLVIASMRPAQEVVLVESRRRRIEWLDRMVTTLELPNCRVVGRRIETIDPFAARIISARAFAPLPKLLELSRPFSTTDTIWLLPKGRSAEQELLELPRKARVVFHVEQSQTDPEAKILVGKEANRP